VSRCEATQGFHFVASHKAGEGVGCQRGTSQIVQMCPYLKPTSHIPAHSINVDLVLAPWEHTPFRITVRLNSNATHNTSLTHSFSLRQLTNAS